MSASPASRTGYESPRCQGNTLPEGLVFPKVDGHEVSIPRYLSSNACQRTKIFQLNVTEINSLEVTLLIARLKKQSYGTAILHAPTKQIFLNIMINESADDFESPKFKSLLGEYCIFKV